MQRVESCHLFFSCQSMHMSKQGICKEECKKRTLTVSCSVFLAVARKKQMFLFKIITFFPHLPGEGC